MSFKKFLLRFNNLLQQYTPLKKLLNKVIKTMKKSWISKIILKSIDKKNKVYQNKKCYQKEKLYGSLKPIETP